MLLAIAGGVTATGDLALKTKSNRNSISAWKKIYREHGLDGLLSDGRGGNRRAAISPAQKQQLQQKLADPRDGFVSYKQATEWINKTFGLQMEYHAVHKYLTRNFKTKLKAGRKTHVNKDENATALFKKPVREAETY